jgi:hypothetical protein
MYLPNNNLFSYLSTYIWNLFLKNCFTKVKANINSVEVHPQLSNNRHPVDGWCTGGCRFTVAVQTHNCHLWIHPPKLFVFNWYCQRTMPIVASSALESFQIGYVTKICLNYFMDDHHFDHITKSYKETLVLSPYQTVHQGCQQRKSRFD